MGDVDQEGGKGTLIKLTLQNREKWINPSTRYPTFTPTDN